MVIMEALEQRRLLSTVAQTTVQPDDVYVRAADSSSTTIQGYTPSQISSAYGFDNITFDNGTVKGDGQGQTIAIVDAYNDPNISSDLGVFDSEFGIAAPTSFKVVNETGGSSLPSTDAGWAGEISLDVEWAHAMAPAANILLVEASSDSLTDLLAAVNYARNAAGVSVVSMSWGGSEFFGWSNGEFSSETEYDSYFTTPSGHQGVTFIAAAGDSGAQSGVQWPAASPNVISVGGTSLTLNSDGTYGSESSWSGTSGGYSEVESEPSYQDTAQSTGARSVPDVSYDADPNTGFAVYDSVSDDGYVGWQEVGGTSAGAPQWAALVAIADQGRALAGKSTLDGATQTLEALYDTYTATTTSYDNTFNDVVDTGGGGYQFPWGGYGNSQDQATTGYDTATGLGTPKAAAVVSVLTDYSASASGGSGSSGSGSGSGTTALSASPVSGTIVSHLPTSALTGSSGTVRIRLSNTSDSAFTGPVDITLYASTDSSTGDGTVIGTLDIADVTLTANGHKTVKVTYEFPSSLADGNYNMIAAVASTDTASADIVASKSVKLSSATVDLADAFDTSSVSVIAGQTRSIAVTIENLGNVTADGTYTISLYSSDTAGIDGSSVLLDTSTERKIKLKAGESKTVHVSFTAPADKTPGTYFLVAQLNPASSLQDSNASDNVTAVLTV